MNEEDLIRQAMAALGRRTSDAKKESSRKNGTQPKTLKRAIETFLCTCGDVPNISTSHKSSCLRGQALKRRGM